MPELSGLDVYEGQGDIDWSKVPDLTFVAAKASQHRPDTKFARNWQAMRDRGFPVRAAYHFATLDPAATQARLFRRVVGPLEPGEVPAIDLEPTKTIPVLSRTEAIDLRNAVEDAFQREALIYIGVFYANAREIIGDRPWWFPSYGVPESRARQQAFTLGLIPHVWQWGGGSEGADVPGVTPGARDDSNMVLRPAELIEWAGTPAPQPRIRRDTNMVEYTNGAGCRERFQIFPDGSLKNSWETAPGNGQFVPWESPVPGEFIGLASTGPVLAANGSSWLTVVSAPYGVQQVIVQPHVGGDWSVHDANDLARYLASQK